MGFRSYIRHFLRAILMPFRPSLPWCFPIRELPFEQKEQSKARAGAAAAAEGKSRQNHSFLWVSEVTLGTFWTQFWCLSVPHCHGVFRSGSCRLNRRSSRSRSSSRRRFAAGRWFFPWCFPIWGPDVKVAKSHSSSKRKKEPKASFSIGFRSYVRHFRGVILGLLRPSEAWCFAAGRWFFLWCLPICGLDAKVAKIHSSSKRKKQPKASFSIGCRSYVRHFRGASLGLLCPSEAWEEKGAKFIIFYGFQKLR